MKRKLTISSLLLAWFCLAVLGPMSLALPPMAFHTRGAFTTSAHVVNTATFNGSTSYLRFSGTFTMADGKLFAFSFWINPDTDNTERDIYFHGNGSNPRLQISLTSVNKLRVRCMNSSNALICDITTVGTITAADGWVHVHATANLADSGLTKIYFNGSAQTLEGSPYTFTDANIDYDIATERITIGANNGSTPNGEWFTGALAELWVDNVYLDALAAFYDAGNPVDLGVNGENPRGGIPPDIYFSSAGSGTLWHNQTSTGVTFTQNGTIGSTTSPP
jgi:hypothetical protein